MAEKRTGRKRVIALAVVVLVVCISSVVYSKQVAARGRDFDNGVDALRTGDYSNALSLLQSATDQDPTNARGFYELGNAYEAQDRATEAVESWTRAAELEPQMYAAYIARGIHYLRTGRAAASLQDFDRALALHPSMETYLQRGLALQALGRHQLAIDSFAEALSRSGLKDPVIEAARDASVKAMETQAN